jgi:AraC family transcriptional regulator
VLKFDVAALPSTCSYALVARSSATEPDFVAVDRTDPRLIAARWRRRAAHLSEPTRLEDFLLSYCARGGAVSTIVVDGVRMSAQQQAGTVTFLPAGRTVQWMFEAPSEVVHVHLYIASAAMREHVLASGAVNGTIMPAVMNLHDSWLDSFFRLLVAEYEECEGAGQPDELNFLERTSGLLLRHLVSQHTGGATDIARSSHVSPLRPGILARVVTFAETNLDREIPLKHLAAMASMSVDHFVRAFKYATGSTPHRYLLERRLGHACELLRDSDETVAVIAGRCGFARAAHFSTTFHRHYGMTPTQYRRRV